MVDQTYPQADFGQFWASIQGLDFRVGARSYYDADRPLLRIQLATSRPFSISISGLEMSPASASSSSARVSAARQSRIRPLKLARSFNHCRPIGRAHV